MSSRQPFSEAVLELSEYVRIFRKRGWIVVLAAAVAILGAIAFSQLQAPVYRSTVYINVWPGRLEWGLQQTIKGLMRNYAGIIRSRGNAEEVVERLGLSVSPDEVRGMLTVSSIESDFVLQIDVDDEDALRARNVAQASAEIFVEQITAHMLKMDQRDRVEVSLRDYALPGHLHKPKWKINALAGGVLGGIVGIAIAYVLEWLSAEIIRSSVDIESCTGLAVLGSVPAVDTGSARVPAQFRNRRGRGSLQMRTPGSAR